MLGNEEINMLLNKLSAVVETGNFVDIESLALSQEYFPLRYANGFVSIVEQAIRLKQKETVALFLDMEVSPFCFISTPNQREECTLLRLSANVDCLPVTQLLTERSLKCSREYTLRQMPFALSDAIKKGHVDTVAYFLEQGCSLNPKDLSDKLLDMELPPSESNQRLITMLLDRKPDINICFHYLFERLTPYLEDPDEAFDTRYCFAVTTLLNTSNAKHFIGAGVPALWYFLNNFDVSNVNLTTISVNGNPLTREQLVAKKVHGADKAIFSDVEGDNALNANPSSSGLVHYRQQLHDALAEQEQMPVASCSYSCDL